MIPFLRRRKEDPIFLDCYTYSRHAYNHAKVDYARRYIPEWWKAEKKFFAERKTIKHCRGMLDYYSKGIVIPLWGELELTVHPLGHDEGVYSWVSSNEDFDVHTHDKVQWTGFGSDNLCNVKFISPWAFKTREAVSFAWSQPTWSQPDTFNGLTALPGVVEYKTQTVTHINCVVEQREESQTFSLAPLTPMAILHPLTERKVELRHHLVSMDSYERIARRGGGMLLNTDEGDVMSPEGAGVPARKKAFWKKADELNTCPFE